MVEVAQKGANDWQATECSKQEVRSYVGRFTMDIVNLATKEKGCLIQHYWEAENFKLSTTRSKFGMIRVRIFFTLMRIIFSLLVFTQLKLFFLDFI